MGRLAACTACRRHIRSTEDSCPFCGVAVAPAPPVAADPTQASSRPLTRAAILFAGATAIAGCGKTTDGAAVPAYGVPAPDMMADAGPPPPSPVESGMMTAPAYGAPPPDLSPPPTPESVPPKTAPKKK